MFSKKLEAQQPSQAQTNRLQTNRVNAAPGFSILGPDTTIKGDVAADSDLHIDGKVNGDVSCATLVQGDSSEITGAIKAGTARLAGLVRGTITVGELVILKSARIEGDVHYTALTIEPGAQVDGHFAVRGAAAPTVKAGPAGEPLLSLASSAF
jgi:cytoskeletal protein CcmA (bactofilin family)